MAETPLRGRTLHRHVRKARPADRRLSDAAPNRIVTMPGNSAAIVTAASEVNHPSPAISVLDLVPVRSDQSTADALATTRGLARGADELGFRRYWLADHHNMPAVAATNPPVLVAMVAAVTERIRIGSGGVMLPNHAPLVVAE